MQTFLKESVLQGTKVGKPLVFSMPLILQSKTKSLRGPVTSQRTCGLLTVKPVWQWLERWGPPSGSGSSHISGDPAYSHLNPTDTQHRGNLQTLLHASVHTFASLKKKPHFDPKSDPT